MNTVSSRKKVEIKVKHLHIEIIEFKTEINDKYKIINDK